MERVRVTLNGREFTIAGDKPQEYIEKVAAYVDEKMQELARVLPAGNYSEAAALAAVNIADEFFSNEILIEEMKTRAVQIESDTRHYIQLWEEAKRNFLQYKDEAQKASSERDGLQLITESAKNEVIELRSRLTAVEESLRIAEQKNETLTARLRAREQGNVSNEELLTELESKNKELESNYFELTMENTQLKGEIERYRKNRE